MKVRVDPELRELIPPLSTEERSGLESDIIRDGRATVPLIVWNGILLDGHNRLEICNVHGLPYTTQDAPEWIKDRRDARIFIRSTALNRRNLGPITRAELAAGNETDLAAKAKERKGGRPKKGKKPVQNSSPVSTEDRKTRSLAAKQAGMSHPTYEAAKVVAAKATPELKQAADRGEIAVSTAAEVAELPPEKQREVVAAGPKAARKAARAAQDVRRDQRRADAAKKAKESAKLDGKYRVIYADPPWKYGDSGYGSGPAEFHYPTMSVDEICALPISEIAHDDAVLFIWVTSPLLEDVFRVINAWGFKYKASFVWHKVKHNVGHYNSVRHEFLLIATRGNCVPDDPRLVESVQMVERGKHSEKPERFREIIDQMYPHGSRIELFARKAVKGWATWGNEVIQ